MKQTLLISAYFDQPEFLQQLVERLADCRVNQGFNNQLMPAGLKALETSSTETYVSGTISLDISSEGESPEIINMPFITCFAFTCIKGKTEPYQMIWSNSMN